jgi:hypothetical protein
MSSDELRSLLYAWSAAATSLTNTMRDLEPWPDAGLRQSRIERSRGEPDSLFAYFEKLRSITPVLAAAIVGMGDDLSIQPLFDLVVVANDGMQALLSSERSPDMSRVEQAFLFAGQLVSTVRNLAAERERAPDRKQGMRKSPGKRGPKSDISEPVRQAIIQERQSGVKDRLKIAENVSAKLKKHVNRGQVNKVLNAHSQSVNRRKR